MNMKLNTLIILFFTILSISANAQYKKGCILEDIDTSLSIRKNYETSRSELPSSVSLLKYAPPIRSQGQLGSCTAWATAYAGMSIVRRIEENSTEINPYSPLNLYNRIKAMNEQEPCSDGSMISQSLNLLKDNGCDQFYESENYCRYASADDEYDDKLFDFEELYVTIFNFKNALNDSMPIIIGVQCYVNDWCKKENLTNGIWNGIYSGGEDGHHAMCIVAYDDYVAGGAFLIMNSWGTDFGQNGYFWIKYEDIFHIDRAYALHHDPEKINPEEDVIIEDVIIEDVDYNTMFRFNNECSLTAYLSLAQYKDGSWISEGWYAAPPYTSINVSISERTQDDIYWQALAVSGSNEYWWYDQYSGTDFCYDRNAAFAIYDNSYPSCPAYKPFYKDSPGFEISEYSRTITCPNVTSRDGEIQLSTDLLDLQIDPRDKDSANMDWKEGMLLFDLYSNRIIKPMIDEEKKSTYTIWYIAKKNKIKQGIFSSEDLVKLKARKFKSKENAERWLAIQQIKK